MITALRGFNDILPTESEKFFYFEKIAENTAAKFGFNRVGLPILEEKALFARCVGESSDIVGKEMYEFVDKGENAVCMRPEGTAGAVRAFIETKLDRAGGIHKWSYFGPMFRYERPQKGRLRQFNQFGVESFGEASVYEDAQIISLADAIFKELGIAASIKLNSLGCPKCAPAYRQKLVDFAINLELCEDCVKRLKLNPLRILDCKNISCKNLLKDAPKITDSLCEECESDFLTLKSTLNSSNIKYEVDKNLVRGLDYYTKTAFEFTADTGGSQNAIAGGGRYDGLIAQLGGKPTPAIGFAIGVERILDLIVMPTKERFGFYIGAMDDSAMQISFNLSIKLRQKDFVQFLSVPKSLKNHLKNADKINAKYCLVIGENELKSNSVWVKDLVNGSEQTLSLDLIDTLFV
ncbi:MAG: hypothetical protein RL154_93 [Pseudomonadota bacterium]|jgi:histidyl-tRNA synthetase